MPYTMLPLAVDVGNNRAREHTNHLSIFVRHFNRNPLFSISTHQNPLGDESACEPN